MSKSPRVSRNDDPPEQPDPEELVEENRELFERIADADLSVSDRVQRALDKVDQEGETDV